MPANTHKIDFPSPSDRPGGSSHSSLVHRKVIPFAPEAEFPPARFSADALPCRQHPEGIAAMLLALGLHLAGFALMLETAQEKSLAEPPAIQVAWIAALRPRAESMQTAPPKPLKPTIKPKPKIVKQTKAEPKAVLSTSAPAPIMTGAPAEKTENVAAPPAAKIPSPASESAANTRQLASPALPAKTDESRLPLTLPNLNAGYLNNPVPRYPEEARERGEQGKVLVRALINADGSVAELAMKKGSGYPDLDRSALETVKKWRFVPARRGAASVSAWVVVPILFSLEG